MNNNRNVSGWLMRLGFGIAALALLAALWGADGTMGPPAGIAQGQEAGRDEGPGDQEQPASEDEAAYGLHQGPEHALVTEDGQIITYVTAGASVGDSYIDQNNDMYEVRRIEGQRVIVEKVGTATMPDVKDALKALEEARAQSEAPKAQAGLLQRLVGAVGGGGRGIDVGIYHTHNAESYRPTSGVEFKDEGDVLRVGQALKEEFEKRGFTAEWVDNSHLPHDGQAYLRSRRTAADISKGRPATILDVHRDAIPRKDEYLAEVEGQTMSQVRLVVGRQNQNREANLEYAKRIKAIADEKYPGLIKGIYHARGNYNQDLGPKMILLEFGTHLTSLEDALRSVPMTADVIAAAAGLTEGAGQGANIGAGAGRTVIWILVLAAVGAVGWVVLNKEGFEGVRSSLGRLVGNRNNPDDTSDGE